MKLPESARALVERVTGGSVTAVRAAGGGSINEAAAVDAGGRTVFVKWHHDPPAGFFAAEADGLARLAATRTVATPTVLACEDGARLGVLVLSYHPPARSTQRSMAAAGRALAQLHGHRGMAPGLDRDNFMGAVPQCNMAAASPGWIAFFRERRLGALASALPAPMRRGIERLDLDALLTEPDGGCALLHGDLWGGNLLSTDRDEVLFIDPATYRGHPEVDLAMTRLFGGFTPAFYDAYQEVAGRFDADLDARLEVLNLYPLLVHVHLFGGGYVRQVEAVVRRYGG